MKAPLYVLSRIIEKLNRVIALGNLTAFRVSLDNYKFHVENMHHFARFMFCVEIVSILFDWNVSSEDGFSRKFAFRRKIGYYLQISGGHVPQFLNRSLEDCAHYCTTKGRICTAFNYNPGESRCEIPKLKSDATGVSLISNEGWEYWEKGKRLLKGEDIY